jgi:hypothetical protein
VIGLTMRPPIQNKNAPIFRRGAFAYSKSEKGLLKR